MIDRQYASSRCVKNKVLNTVAEHGQGRQQNTHIESHVQSMCSTLQPSKEKKTRNGCSAGRLAPARTLICCALLYRDAQNLMARLEMQEKTCS